MLLNNVFEGEERATNINCFSLSLTRVLLGLDLVAKLDLLCWSD